jgi:hypothetical protein
MCPPVGAAAIREASSPTAVTKHKPVNATVTEASSAAAVLKRRLVNVGETAVNKASSPVAVAGHKPVQKAKPLPLKEQVSRSNGTQKARGQRSGKIGWNINLVSGKNSVKTVCTEVLDMLKVMELNLYIICRQFINLNFIISKLY